MLLVRLVGVEPTLAAWKAAILPLNDRRELVGSDRIELTYSGCRPDIFPLN